MKVLNPEYKPHRGLGQTDQEWARLRGLVLAHLQSNAGSAAVDVDALRALDPKLRDDRTWRQLAGDLGLVEVPG